MEHSPLFSCIGIATCLGFIAFALVEAAAENPIATANKKPLKDLMLCLK
jgi:hypothetical protein